MIYKSINYAWILMIVFFKIRCHNAEVVNATSTPVTTVSPILSKFFDRGNPNFREPDRFGNSPNNYPGNPFLPYGNQNDNDPEGFGWDLQDPSQNYFPGRPYQRPGTYPGNQGDGPYHRGPNNYEPNYIPGINHYPRPPYPNRPGNMNGPYQTGGMSNQGGYPNRPMGMPHNIRYNANGGQYPPQGNYQSNPNMPPGGPGNSRPYYPNNLNNIPDSNIQFPGNYEPSNPDQYPAENQGNVPIRPNQNSNYPSYHTNNNPNNAIRYPANNGNSVDSSIQFPNEDGTNAMPGNNNVPDISNLPSNGAPQNQISTNKQLISNNKSNDPNTNDVAAIRGKPAFVPSVTLSPGQAMTGGS